MNKNTAFIEFNYDNSSYSHDTHNMNDSKGKGKLLSVSMMRQIINLIYHLFQSVKKIRIKIILYADYDVLHPIYLKCTKDDNGILLPDGNSNLNECQWNMMNGRYNFTLSNEEIKIKYNITTAEFRYEYDKIIANYIGKGVYTKEKNSLILHNKWNRDYPDSNDDINPFTL